MPRYVYKCAVCSDLFEARHSLEERKTDCEKCENKNSLVRVPAGFITLEQQVDRPAEVGSLVNSFIEDTKKEVKQEKEKLLQEEYVP